MLSLLELLLKFFSDRNYVAIFDDLLRELIKELLFAHWIQTIKVSKLLEPRILSS